MLKELKCVKFEDESKYKKAFLSLTEKLYQPLENMEDKTEIKKLLNNTHPLSKYFKLDKFLIYQGDEVVARFVVTTYANDNIAYLGFYECIDNDDVAKFLFEQLYEFAKKKKYIKIIGPVNASFWIGYRMKINLFDKLPYTGEPYNKEYYLKQFKDNGMQICEHYTSNIYNPVEDEYTNEKYSSRLVEFQNKGYQIISPKAENFGDVLKDLYYLLTNLYSDFPIYKDLSLEDFMDVFSRYKKVINMSMVKIAYFENKMVGFFISVPNYKNKVYRLNFINLLKILKEKNKPKEYVMLYMGVDSKHTGLRKSISIFDNARTSKDRT